MGTKDENKSSLQKGLQFLLQDPAGRSSFETYLEKHGESSYLEFIWACQGMKALVVNKESESNKQLVTCLYRQYILSGTLSTILSNKTFLKIAKRMSKNDSCEEIDIFDEAEEEIKDYLALEVYSRFLREEISTNGEMGIKDADYRYLRSNNKSVKRSEPVINQDDLPNLVPWTKGTSFPGITCPNKPPKDPEIFAKELSEKLEALQTSPKQQNENKCTECLKTELEEVQKSFSTQLAKAIEDKLIIFDEEIQKVTLTDVGKSDEIPNNMDKQYMPKVTVVQNSKVPRNRKARRKKKINNGIMLRNLCGLNVPKNTDDDSISLLSFHSIKSANSQASITTMTSLKSDITLSTQVI